MRIRRTRSGSMLLEVSLAITVLAVALVSVAQLLAVAARQRHETRWRTVATREVANVTEQVMALNWADCTAERLGEMTLHPDTQAALREASLSITVDELSEPRTARRCVISLTYHNMAGRPVEPIRLVAWKFSPGGDR